LSIDQDLNRLRKLCPRRSGRISGRDLRLNLHDFKVSNLQCSDDEGLGLEDLAIGVLVILQSGDVGLGDGVGSHETGKDVGGNANPAPARGFREPSRPVAHPV